MTELERLRAMRDALEQMVERLGRKEVHATRDQVRDRNPDGYRSWLEGGSGWAGGETYEQMHARVVATLERLLEAHPSGRILVVAHGGTVRTVVAHAVGLPGHDRRHIDGAANCSLTAIENPEGALRLIAFNDVGHLL